MFILILQSCIYVQNILPIHESYALSNITGNAIGMSKQSISFLLKGLCWTYILHETLLDSQFSYLLSDSVDLTERKKDLLHSQTQIDLYSRLNFT